MSTTNGFSDSQQPQVLVVDDDRNLRTIIRTNLELAGFGVITAPDGPSALMLLDEQIPDLVVLDVMMPLMDGYAVLGRIRRHATASHVPVIILTARTDQNDAILSLEAGADDFIAKPFSPQEMLARVRAKIRRANVDSSLQPLTRLPGNIAIESEIRKRFEAREPWAVIYIDLDNFKSFNDAYGFVRGDDAIKFVATTIQDVVKADGDGSEFIGHIGGDDFILVSTPRTAETLANEICNAFDAAVPDLYEVVDKQRGWIQTKDRRGNSVRFPIMSLSMAIVTNASRIRSYQQIGEIAAELKAYAKRQPGSYVATEKRK